MAYYLYQKYKAKKAAESGSPGPQQTNDPEPSTSAQARGENNASPPAQPAPPKESLKWRLYLMLALLFPIILETLDYTVVATAQPHIASVFHRLDLQSYIGTAYLLTSTVFLPVFASLADIFGRHWALQISLVFFIIGSAISTGAENMITMIMGRGVAGVGAAGLISVVRIILSDTKSLDANTSQVTSLFFLYAVGYSIGPVIGGLLVSISFRWVFAINLPCCVTASFLCYLLLRGRTLPGQPPRRLPTTVVDPTGKQTFTQNFLRIDWVGAALFIGGGILVLLGLNWGSTTGWHTARVIVSLVVGGLLFVACILWEYILERQEKSPTPSSLRILWADPMIPLDVFRSYDICAVQYASFISGMVMLVMFYFISIFMTIVTGLSATRAGVQLVYFAPGMGLGSLIGISMIKITRQPKYPIILGSVILCVALGLVSYGMDRQHEAIVNAFMAVSGVATGLSMGPLAVQARFVMSSERVAVVTALTLFFRSFGGTVGLAQCAAVLNAKVKADLIALIKSGALSPSELESLAQASSHGGLNSLQGIDALDPGLQSLVRDAFRKGTMWCFISLVPWCVVGVILTLFLSKIEDTDKVGVKEKVDPVQVKEKHGCEDEVGGEVSVEKRPEQG